jgi:hypothetical protein
VCCAAALVTVRVVLLHWSLSGTHTHTHKHTHTHEHTHTQTYTHSVGLLWTRDWPVADTSTWQHKKKSQETGNHACLRRDSNSQSLQSKDANPCLRPRGHCDRPR